MICGQYNMTPYIVPNLTSYNHQTSYKTLVRIRYLTYFRSTPTQQAGMHLHNHSRSTCTHNSRVCWELPYHHLAPTTLSHLQLTHSTVHTTQPQAGSCTAVILCSPQLSGSPFQMRAILSLLVLFCYEEHLLLEPSPHQRK